MIYKYTKWMVPLLLLAMWLPGQAQVSNMAAYAGGTGAETFNKMVRLSDGTVLISGGATSLDWVPASVPRTTLTVPAVVSATDPTTLGIDSRDTGQIGFLLHLSPNLDTIKAVVQFPANTVTDVNNIKFNTAPGQPTGNIFVSGRRNRSRGTTGWYIARLNNNFVNGVPTGCVWTYDLYSRPRATNQFDGPFPNNGQDSDHKLYQPFDVQSDNKVVFVIGTEFESNWAALHRLRANGLALDTIGNAPVHWGAWRGKGQYANVTGTTEVRTTNINRLPDSVWVRINPGITPAINDSAHLDSILYSGFVLKVNRSGSNLRSYSQADFDFTTNDENGNPGRKGSAPEDLFYANPCLTGNCPNGGPGYTGYSLFNPNNNTATNRVVALNIDKRTNTWYFGMATYSEYMASGPHDFEPAVVAMESNGRLKWWARLYEQKLTGGSRAGQVVDGIELDYNNNEVVVLARSINNAPNNLWEGNQLTAKPGGQGFQNRYSGTVDDSQIGWLGRLKMDQLQITASTYIGEPVMNARIDTASTQANLDGWYDLNKANLSLATTRINDIRLMPNGSVAVVGNSNGRTVTTANAFMANLKPDRNATVDSMGAPNSFVRVYNRSLDTVVYSSLLTPIWDPTSNGNTNGVTLSGVIPTTAGDGLLVVGTHRLTPLSTSLAGGNVPTTNAPDWASLQPRGQSALLARLSLNCGGGRPALPDSILGLAAACQGSPQTYRLKTPSAGAVNYAWSLPNTNFTGFSSADTLALTSSFGNGGNLRAVAINACGVSPIRVKAIGTPLETPRPSLVVPISPTPHCAGTDRWYYAPGSPGATQYFWRMPGAGWTPASGILADTATLVDSILIRVSNTAVAGQLQVRALGACGLSQANLRNMPAPATVPARPTITQSGTTLTSSATTGNQWYLNGQPIAGATARTYNHNNVGGLYQVRASNSCGMSDTAVAPVIVGLRETLQLTGVKLYPQPASQLLNLELSTPLRGEFMLVITDLAGRRLSQSQWLYTGTQAGTQISIAHLPAGSYLLQIGHAEGLHTLRFVKE